MRAYVAGVVIVGLLGACKNASKPDGLPAPGATAPPVATGELDALWAMAPEGAIAGIVISANGLARLESAALELEKVAATVPQAAVALVELQRELERAAGTKTPRLADFGMSSKRGAAIFFDHEDPLVMLLPISDRDKFVRVAKGTKGTVDKIDDLTCKPVKSFYACAKDAAILDKLGAVKLTDSVALAGVRADIEIAGSIPSDHVTYGIAVQPERGAFVARGAFKGMTKAVAKVPGAVKPRLAGDVTAGFGIMNLAGLLEDVPPIEVAPGVMLDALAHSIIGPITLTLGAGDRFPDVRVPLADVSLAQKLINQCEQLPPLQQLGAKLANGVCHFDVPQFQLAADAWIDGTTLRLGTRGAKPSTVALPMTALGHEIAMGEWVFALWGRGSILALPPLPALSSGGVPPQVLVALRSMIGLNELGLAFRAEGDTMRFILGARTAWSNPDDVLAKLAAIAPEELVSGKASATGKAIADASPRSPFALDYKAGFGGVMAIASGIGMIAAVAIPAFMEYMKKSKKSEASLQLNKLAKVLKIYYAENNAFPKGSVPPTPSASCCDGPNHKCFEPGAWQQPIWQQLELQIDEPHLYRYAYESDGNVVTVRAISDLDCDGKEAQYTLTVTAAGGTATAVIKAPPRGTY